MIKASDYSKKWNLENLFKISKKLDFSYRRSKVSEGDILFTIVGSVGNINIVPYYLEGANITQQTARLSINQNYYSNLFIYNYLLTEKNKKQTLNYLKEGVQPSINLSDLEKFIINIPSLQEQEKIANFISSIDKKISLTEEKLELFREYKKGVMQKIFSQELRFKDSEGNDYPEWEEKILDEIGEIITGKTPSTKEEKYWNGEILFVTPTDMKGNKYQISTERKVTKEIKIKILPKGTIMFTCIASIGKMSIATDLCITNQQINSIIVNEKINNEYVYYYLLSIVPKIQSTKSTTTMPIINKTEFSKFEIQLPTLEEQQKIADFLSSIDSKIENIEKELVGLKEFKKGLLQQMFV